MPERVRRLRAERAEPLHRALASALKRDEVESLVRAGQVFVDGHRARDPQMALPVGARILVHPRPADPIPEIPILFEDEAWLVVSKPSGVAVSATETSAAETVEEHFSDRDARVVHRLDRGTTGVLVLGKGTAAAAELSRAFADRRVEKRYEALVEGQPPDGWVKAALGPDKRRPRAQRVHPSGKAAETELKTLATRDGLAWVEARPRTGRTHQIRVHLAHLGAPILGDVLYGGPTAVRLAGEICRLERPLLHAAALTLPGERRFEVEPPEDFASLVRAMPVC